MNSAELVRIGGVEIDLRCLPVIIVRFDDSQRGADIAKMGERVAQVAKGQRYIGMIHDTSALTTVLGAAERKELRDSVEKLLPLMDEKAVGSALIIKNSLIRGAMTAAKWFMAHEFEEKVFGTPREGADWIVTRFRQVGAPLSPATEARLAQVIDPKRPARSA